MRYLLSTIFGVVLFLGLSITAAELNEGEIVVDRTEG